MMATVMYASLPSFYKTHRDEIEKVVTGAGHQADWFVRRLPNGMDKDAFRGEAGEAAWLAALTYRPELGGPVRLLGVDHGRLCAAGGAAATGTGG